MTIINRYKTPQGTRIQTETITTDEKNQLALEHYLDTICRSWTYDRMTDAEKSNLEKVMQRAFHTEFCRLFGTAEQRRKQVDMIYEGFLAGLGYYETTSWREERKEA